MQWILSSSDRYIIGLFRNAREVGLYSFSYSLATNIFNILTNFLLLGAYPKIISAMNKNGNKGVSRPINKYLRYYLIISIPIFCGITALSKGLIIFMSSDKYLDGRMTLIITSLSMVIYGATFYYNKVWELTNSTKIIFVHTIIAGLFNLLLNFLLVPYFGYEASAYTTLASYILYLFITIYRSKKIMNIKIDILSTFKISLASLIMYVFVKFYLDNVVVSLISLIIAAIIGIIIYLIFLVIFNEVSEEIKIVKGVFAKANYNHNKHKI